MLNPTLSDLVGGIQTVTLCDEEARRRGTQKTVLERKAPPTFDVVVEIVERDSVIVHRDVAETVDAILRGHMVPPESRWREGGELRAATKYDYKITESPTGTPTFAALDPLGGFGAFGRGRGNGGGGLGLRPLPGRGRSRGDPRAGRWRSPRNPPTRGATSRSRCASPPRRRRRRPARRRCVRIGP